MCRCVGRRKSPGTRAFSLRQNACHKGLVEARRFATEGKTPPPVIRCGKPAVRSSLATPLALIGQLAAARDSYREAAGAGISAVAQRPRRAARPPYIAPLPAARPRCAPALGAAPGDERAAGRSRAGEAGRPSAAGGRAAERGWPGRSARCRARCREPLFACLSLAPLDNRQPPRRRFSCRPRPPAEGFPYGRDAARSRPLSLRLGEV